MIHLTGYKKNSALLISHRQGTASTVKRNPVKDKPTYISFISLYHQDRSTAGDKLNKLAHLTLASPGH